MAYRHEPEIGIALLTKSERRRDIAAGLAAVLAILLFVGLALAALLFWDVGQSSARLLSPYTLSILRFTLWQAVLSTLASVVLAVPVVLALARRPDFPARVWIIRLMALPMGLPALIGALGLIGIWGRQGAVNDVLAIGGLAQPFSIYGLAGILLAHTFFNVPLAIRLLLPALERLPAEYWLLSANLGMRSGSILRFIEWPALRPVVPLAAGLIFMLCATSFTLVLVLGGGPAATTLEVAIYQALRFDFDPSRAVALAALQMLVAGAAIGAMALLRGHPQGLATVVRRSRRLDGRSAAARAWDGCIIAAAVVFVASPLAAVLFAGVRADLWRLATSPLFLQAARTSLVIAMVAATIAVTAAVAITAARGAIRDPRRPGNLLQGLSFVLSGTSSLVLVVPPLILGTGWFLLLRGTGVTGELAPYLVACINALMALPFVDRVISPAIDDHRRQTQRLTAALGISGLDRLRWIDIPVLTRPLLTAFSFAMALSLGDLGAVALFGSTDFITLPWLVYSTLSSYRTNDADGLALILGMLCLVLTILGTPRGKDERHV